MVHRYEHSGIVWIDLQSPSVDEIRSVSEEFKIHPLVAHELMGPSERARIDPYEDTLYLILQFPNCAHREGSCTAMEIDFVIGDNVLITVHYAGIRAITEFRRMFEINSILEKTRLKHAGHLFYFLIRHLYQDLGSELDIISNELARVEENIFRGKERLMVESLSRVSRTLIDFRRSIRGHETILESFERASLEFFEKPFKFYISAILGEHKKTIHLLDSTQEILHELRATNDSLVSTKTGEITKNLTLMAFVTFPLSLLAAIFGMNTENNPIVGHPFDFWIIVVVMATGMLYMFAFFKHKKWL
ncbi:MAG: magnesium transporter CorA family protein [Candidatus Vogelbacteria bacterium]|nr:magnesium transporter CorA family protein [Candidatus Vogelbacteria bacterium]